MRIAAHSPAEAWLGVLLGTLVCVYALLCWPSSRAGFRLRPVLAGLIMLGLANVWVLSSLKTNRLVGTLATILSGQDPPYTRELFHAADCSR